MEGVHTESALETDPKKICDIFGDPEIIPRVGGDFQANIPSLLLWSDDNPSRNPDVDNDRVKGHSGPEDKQLSEIEEAGFLLGLYVFGKNFVLVKKLVGSATMGDIMSFYYGKFYNSTQYRRWSEGRRKKSRKCVYGNKIFTGSRQQEFVSRLLTCTSEELQEAVMEVSKKYAVGNISVEEYAFNVKAIVGLECLIKAVAIGEGRKDLTGPSVDISKANQPLVGCLNVPAGKAWSSLTATGIIEFLTGNCRLSKAKSIDLFWEAVWPRLLARGWHSEQPKGYAYVSGSKQSLVFLVPGVKKFSRRKLVKGEDYFDSVSDILNIVAKEPTLIDLEAQTNQSSNSQVTVAAKFDDGAKHNSTVNGYTTCLKEKEVNPDIEFVGLTVIDTTRATSAHKVTYWPVRTLNTPFTGSQFEEIENNILEEPREQSDSGDAFCFEKNTSKETVLVVDHNICRSHANGQISSSLPKQITSDVVNNAVTENELQKKRSRSIRSINQSSCLDTPAVKKKKNLTVCSHRETGQYTALLYDISSQRDDKRSNFHTISVIGNEVSQTGLSQENLAPKVCSSHHASKNYAGSNSVALNNELTHEKPRGRMVIDLNLPYNSDNDLDGAPHTEMNDNKGDANMEHESVKESRRHSTRNRPLTAKVLDAIAHGFFEVAPKRKREQSSSPDCGIRPSHKDLTANELMTTGFGAGISDMEGHRASSASSRTDMLLSFENQPMGEDTGYIW